MYKKIIISVAIGAGLLCGVMMVHKSKSTCCASKVPLITQSNTVGIAADDVCYLMQDTNTVECESGTVFTGVTQRESALTGTPGYLSGPGYIGYVVSKPSTPSLMGSGKRIDIYQAEK
jgi:hypothetical protein